MIIARLDGIEFPAVAPELTDLGQRHPVVQKIRHRNLSGLNFRIRKLHAERYSQAAPLGRVKRQLPDGMQIELAGPALHVTPVTANVQDIDERKRRELFDVLLDGFRAAARRKR